MKYTKECSIYEFEFWAGAKQTIEILTEANLNLDTLEELIILCYFDTTTPSETEINDFVWFETEIIAQAYGFNNFDEIINLIDRR